MGKAARLPDEIQARFTQVRPAACVLFELGARWGAKQSLAPLIGGGHGPDILAGPLSGLNALLCTREDLLQLVANFAAQLGVAAESPDVYSGQVDRVVQVSQELASRRGLEVPAAAGPQTVSLSDFACDYLMEFSRPRNEGQIYGGIDDWKGRAAAEYQAALEKLQSYGLVSYIGGAYKMTSNGWKLSDQLWQLKILDALPDTSSKKDGEIAELVVLTDGDAESNELRRHLTELENLGFISISKTRGPWHVRVSFEGITHRKQRPLSLD